MTTKKKLFTKSKILSIDLETTSLDTSEARIIEFGCSIFEAGEYKNRFSIFFHPGFEISKEVSDVTGIHPEQLVGAPRFSDFFSLIQDILLDSDVWMFYNAPYDMGVLKNEYERLGESLPNKPIIDVLVLFRKFERSNKGKKLTNAASRYSIPFISAHRADDDAHMTQLVFWRMLKIKPELRDEIESTIKKQRKWAESQANQLKNFFRFNKSKGKFVYPDLSIYERGFSPEIFSSK